MKKETKLLSAGIFLLIIFAVFTLLVQKVDIGLSAETGTETGFSTLNTRFHELTGTSMELYYITDRLGLIPLCVCMIFGTAGFMQIIKRKNILKADRDLILLGIYYLSVFCVYLLFEKSAVNYRPILIDGLAEVSYPSSTVLLVLSVMPSLVFQCGRRLKNTKLKKTINILTVCYSLFMIIGRTVSGVHWLTDIIGSLFLASGMFLIYKSVVLRFER